MLSVWCPYCATWHLHGQGDGHRSAQCQNRRSPFIETGYIIKKKHPLWMLFLLLYKIYIINEKLIKRTIPHNSILISHKLIHN
ncbi:hypothetical protein QPL83_00010 (plasmid) [Bacillus toyonensis]|nr:hypothetical protein [Bacillus toyonensis]WIG34234.1 hypothetical protein QPL83_00010 [Bacillus toyonensis]